MPAVNEGKPQGLTEREQQVYEWTVVHRLTQFDIARRLDISQPRVSQILADARAKLPPVDLEAVRNEAIEQIVWSQRLAAELAMMEGAPVTAGKDGEIVYDPVEGPGGERRVVRDYSGRIAATKLLLEAQRDMRKLLGADAATKTEISAGVRHEVVGIDPSEMI